MEKADFQISDNEIIFFVDFNCTLVDYDKIVARNHIMCNDAFATETVASSRYLKVALNNFEKSTGLTPVICVLTNSSESFLESENNCPIALSDFYKIFLRKRQGAANPVSKYLRYVVMRENDKFFCINHDCTSLDDAFFAVPFGSEALNIKMSDTFHKCEGAKRMLTVIDPLHRSKFMFFAGDTIKDDYPMKYARTEHGLCKIFVRPGNRRTISWQTKSEFCRAKGYEFTSLNRHGRKVRCFDDCFENPNNIDRATGKPKPAAVPIDIEDRQALLNFDDGDHVILTQKNSKGLAEGIDKAAKIICQANSAYGKQY